MATNKNELPDEESGNPFISLRQLLKYPRETSVATIATGIEKEGIYVIDQFGRYKKCNKTTQEAQTALDLLADVYAFECENWGDERQDQKVTDESADPDAYLDNHDQQHPLDECQGNGDPFSTLGWAIKVLPDFVTIRSQQTEISRKALATTKKVFSNNLHVIAALLDFIDGSMLGADGKPVKKHPSFENDTQLKQDIEGQYRKFGGVSERRLDTTFSEVRKFRRSTSQQK